MNMFYASNERCITGRADICKDRDVDGWGMRETAISRRQHNQVWPTGGPRLVITSPAGIPDHRISGRYPLSGYLMLERADVGGQV